MKWDGLHASVAAPMRSLLAGTCNTAKRVNSSVAEIACLFREWGTALPCPSLDMAASLRHSRLVRRPFTSASVRQSPLRLRTAPQAGGRSVLLIADDVAKTHDGDKQLFQSLTFR